MLRFLAGGLCAFLLMGLGMALSGTGATGNETAPLAVPPPEPVIAEPEPLPEPPRATERTREEKRFDRYDKDRDDRITREERLASRRKDFARLDTNGDGRLGFEEWAVKTTDQFREADADKSGWLSRKEFATTAPKRKPKPKPKCSC